MSRGEYEILGKTKADRITINDAEMTGLEEEKKYQQIVIPGLEEEVGEVMLMNDNSKKRQFIERCEMKAKTVCNPIIEWGDREIWDFLQSEKIETNPLYKIGFSRVGCVGCPMAGKNRYFEFNIFPSYQRAYIHAFDRMLEAMRTSGNKKPIWKNGEEVFSWWMEDGTIPGQIEIDEYLSGLK